jgi:hypothetical protein
MTIKVRLGVEPIHETAKVWVKTSKDDKAVEERTYFLPAAPVDSASFELEEGVKLEIAVVAEQKISYDKDQFSVTVEPIEKPHVEHYSAPKAAPKAHAKSKDD